VIPPTADERDAVEPTNPPGTQLPSYHASASVSAYPCQFPASVSTSNWPKFRQAPRYRVARSPVSMTSPRATPSTRSASLIRDSCVMT
jgi:hypothetical protein